MLVSFDIKFIGRDQKQRWNGEAYAVLLELADVTNALYDVTQ